MLNKTIALVGRPNVGKSTLFNRLSTGKKAIVHDQAGVTMDRKYSPGAIGPLKFTIIDTPGLEESEEGKLEHRMMLQTVAAIQEADLVCLIVDERAGVTPTDQYFANMIRKYTKHYMLIVNKCEKQFGYSPEYYKLGFGDPVPISAEHGTGMMGLYEFMAEKFSAIKAEKAAEPDELQTIQSPWTGDCIQIVVAGRPNAGKSTFINALISEDRLLVGPEAGITRESITIDWEYKDHKLKLIDTAGLRKRANVTHSLERLSTSDTTSSIRFANTVVLMMDANNPLEQQDLNIANYVIEEGRSLVIVVNKSDLIKDIDAFKDELNYQLETNLGQIRGVPVVYISALNKQNLNKVLDECVNIYKLWNTKISTSKLNNWLYAATEDHPLPLQKGGKRVRIKYMTQTKARPPTFKLFTNNPDKVTDAYKKYLMNSLRDNFNMPGVPIRFMLQKTENPYV